MQRIIILLLCSVMLANCSKDGDISPKTNNFFHVEENGAYLPVMVRGNTASGKILLYIQGGPALNTLDFAYVDYPGWKTTIEEDYAVAYYDQRGMGNAQGTFDLETVTIDQYLTDLRKVVQALLQLYPETEVYLLGHSWGGWLSYLYLQTFAEHPLVAGTIAMDAPFTTDQDEIRWSFRHEFLVNVASEFIDAGTESAYWEDALQWALDHPQIDEREEKRQWNHYVYNGLAKYEVEVPISAGDIFKVLFASSYNLHPSLLNVKKWEAIADRLFTDQRGLGLMENLHQVRGPVLLITGRFDDIAPPEELQYGLERLGSAQKELIVLPEAGHDSFLSQPALFRQAVREFVN